MSSWPPFGLVKTVTKREREEKGRSRGRSDAEKGECGRMNSLSADEGLNASGFFELPKQGEGKRRRAKEECKKCQAREGKHQWLTERYR